MDKKNKFDYDSLLSEQADLYGQGGADFDERWPRSKDQVEGQAEQQAVETYNDKDLTLEQAQAKFTGKRVRVFAEETKQRTSFNEIFVVQKVVLDDHSALVSACFILIDGKGEECAIWPDDQITILEEQKDNE